MLRWFVSGACHFRRGCSRFSDIAAVKHRNKERNMNFGDISRFQFETKEELERQKEFGPITVSLDHETTKEEKILATCRREFPELSTRFLKYCFVSGNVSLNGRELPSTHESEARRVRQGDKVSIRVQWDQLVRQSFVYEQLNVVHATDEVAIVVKDSGEDSSRYSLFGVSYRLKLWNGLHFGSACEITDIPRSHSGLILVSPTPDARDAFLKKVSHGKVRLYFSAITFQTHSVRRQSAITSRVSLFDETTSEVDSDNKSRLSLTKGPESEEFNGFATKLHDQIARLVAETKRTVKSRWHGELLLTEYMIELKPPAESNNFHSGSWLSHSFRSVCNYLMVKDGRSVVGYDGSMKSKRAAFVCWNRIDVKTTSGLWDILAVPLPNKFYKFLDVEGALHDRVNEKLTRSAESLREHLERFGLSESSAGIVLFCGLPFRISSDVMRPRQASESLVEAALRFARSSANSTYRILDLGTGSGNLLLATMYGIVQQSPECLVEGTGVDISPAALTIAQENALLLLEDKSSTKTRFVVGDFSDPDLFTSKYNLINLSSTEQPVDLILCNPPYSSKSERNRLSASTKAEEPALALFAHDEDTLFAFRQIARTLSLVNDALATKSTTSQPFKPNETLLIIEIGHGQERGVRGIFEESFEAVYEADVVLRARWRYAETVFDQKRMQRALVFVYGTDATLSRNVV